MNYGGGEKLGFTAAARFSGGCVGGGGGGGDESRLQFLKVQCMKQTTFPNRIIASRRSLTLSLSRFTAAAAAAAALAALKSPPSKPRRQPSRVQPNSWHQHPRCHSPPPHFCYHHRHRLNKSALSLTHITTPGACHYHFHCRPTTSASPEPNTGFDCIFSMCSIPTKIVINVTDILYSRVWSGSLLKKDAAY